MKKKIIWIILILVLVLVAGYIVKSGIQAIPVETERVITGSIESFIEEIGSLIPEEETSIYSVSAGRVIEAPKKAGETVIAGEILVKLDDSDLLLQIKALNAKKLALLAQFDEIKNKGEDESIRSLKAQVNSAEALYSEAKRITDNNKILYEAGAISLEAYENSLTRLTTTEASLETAKSSLELAEKEISVYLSKQYEAMISEIQTGIDRLRLMVQEMIIKSPIDGLITDAQVKEGEIVQTGSKLYDIGGGRGFYIESDILIEDIKDVKTGSLVRINDEDLGIYNITGRVRKIFPKAESIMSDLGIEQKRVKVEIALDNEAEGLRPGYDMTVNIITESKNNVLVIDEKAVFDYQGKAHVFVNEDGIAKLRVIEKGIESNGRIEVLKGLKEGEEIVLSPDDTIDEGKRIKSKEAIAQ